MRSSFPAHSLVTMFAQKISTVKSNLLVCEEKKKGDFT